jgi:hypothetical protein
MHGVILPLQEPTLRLVALHLKYLPWKETLIKEFRAFGSMVEGTHARAVRLTTVLQATCRAMHDRVEEQLPWIDNLGHRIAYVAGPLAFLSRLGVLERHARGTLNLSKPDRNGLTVHMK